jgi:hypothetical protein
MASNGLWALPSLSRLSAKPHSSPSRFGDYARVTGNPEVEQLRIPGKGPNFSLWPTTPEFSADWLESKRRGAADQCGPNNAPWTIARPLFP